MRVETVILVLTLSLAAATTTRKRPTSITSESISSQSVSSQSISGPGISSNSYSSNSYSSNSYSGPIQPANFDDYSLYHIYPASFRDSDGDGIGDLKGVTSKLDYLVESNVDAFRLAPIFPNRLDDYGYDISDYRSINPVYGNFQDFDGLIRASKERKLKVFIDLIPNHMSIKSELFKKSLMGVQPYTDYFIWRKGVRLQDGSMGPPNNWVSVHGGSAWTYREERQAYYLHQFGPEQPDLNYYHTDVVQEMHSVMKFWLNKGVDGFSMGSASYLAEHKEFLNEPLTGYTQDPQLYDYTDKVYTRNLEQSYEIVQGWRKVCDEFKPAKQLIIDTHTNVSFAMKYYDYGAKYPLNYELIADVNKSWSVSKHMSIITNWLQTNPESSPSWVTGYPGKQRLVTTCGDKRARAITALTLLLPGVGVTYSGDEIGLNDPEEYLLADEPAPDHDHGQKNHHSHKSNGRPYKHGGDDSYGSGSHEHDKHDKYDKHDNDRHDYVNDKHVNDKHGHDKHGHDSSDDSSDDSNDDDSYSSDPLQLSVIVSGIGHRTHSRTGKKKYGSMGHVKKIGRTPFLWDDSVSAGFSKNPEPWCPVHNKYKELNLVSQRGGNNTFYNYYQAVSALKKSPHFKKSTLVTKELSKDVLAFSRETDSYGKAYVLINYSKVEQRVDFSSFPGIPRELEVYYASEDCDLVAGNLISDYKSIHLSESATAIFLSKDHQFLRR